MCRTQSDADHQSLAHHPRLLDDGRITYIASAHHDHGLKCVLLATPEELPFPLNCDIATVTILNVALYSIERWPRGSLGRFNAEHSVTHLSFVLYLQIK